ncbi:hypothetical protein IUY40_18560 [Flavobacterium sp. ALJ2]|uniref:hypothetical protein n=1 Tax=Flavobacterium sp. ALJ2 TaxID=2786960 RepID=UPI00189CBDD2|nr:hypothetical protein [Flavobacterium sp. ALJ2]MBF7093539.1 hypothetical protein [Flavobacterium sp. ALJ2]
MMNKEKIETILQKNIVDKTGIFNSITPNVVADTVKEITDLIVDLIQQKIIISQSFTDEQLIPDTPLIVGKWYRIYYMAEGDDFSNIGHENESYDYFKATGTYPARWTTSHLWLTNTRESIMFNNTGAIITFETNLKTNTTTIKSNIDLFYYGKVTIGTSGVLEQKHFTSAKELWYYNSSLLYLNICK